MAIINCHQLGSSTSPSTIVRQQKSILLDCA